MKSYDCRGTLVDSQRAFMIPFQYDSVQRERDEEQLKGDERREGWRLIREVRQIELVKESDREDEKIQPKYSITK